MGFRVKVLETDSSYKLKFFGDSQREVNEFLQLCDLPEFSF
ncbi:hypothetical protein ES703_71312 [subsurface metagenome]